VYVGLGTSCEVFGLYGCVVCNMCMHVHEKQGVSHHRDLECQVQCKGKFHLMLDGEPADKKSATLTCEGGQLRPIPVCEKMKSCSSGCKEWKVCDVCVREWCT